MRLRHDVFRRGHEAQHGIDNQNADDRGNNAHQEGQHNRRMHRIMQLFIIVRAVVLRNHHARAGRKPCAQAHQHIADGAGAAHGRQRLLADELPHHNGIHRVIKLLEDQPDHHWNGKFQQLFPDDALRHIQVSASTRRVHPQSFLRNRLCNIFQYLV